MEAGGLKRSEISFRRTGSSGLVWDDKFLGELAKIDPSEPRRLSTQDAPPHTLSRSRSDGGGASGTARQGYKTMRAPSPSVDPPSPKLGCGGLCSVFGKEKKQKRGKRRV